MDRFSKLHPMMQFLFFIFNFVIILSVNNPIFSAISLACAIVYSFFIRGVKAFSSVKYVIMIMIVVSVFNMLFAHYGNDVLFSINETDFTLEALFYGFNQSMVLCAVMLWFSAFSRVIDSEKVVYIFRFTPKLALLFSMVLGFIPRFNKKLDDIRDARLGLDGGEKPKKKLKSAIDNLSALVTYSLESSIITADSMEARAYNPRAVRHSRYKYSTVDVIMILLIVALSAFVISQIIMQNTVFVFDPAIYIKRLSIPSVVCFVILEFLPIIIDLVENVLWKLSVSKA